MKKILSVDGGGIRGIIPAKILSELENLDQLRHNNTNLRLTDRFDLFAGTSTGGLLTSLYLLPDKEDKTKARYTAQEVFEFYKEFGPKIFRLTPLQIIKSGGGLFRSRYDENVLYEFAKKLMGETYVSEVLKDCLITSYDMSSRKALLFSRYSCGKYGDGADYKMYDIARSTSAAPTYFAPSYIKAKDDTSRHLVDGGIYANNPSMCAIVESMKLWPEEPFEKLMMVSAGTGKVEKPYFYEQTRRFGYLGWLVPIIDILMSSVSETVDYQTRQIFALSNNSHSYFRIEPLLTGCDTRMDKASKKNMVALETAAQSYLDHNFHVLESIVENFTKA